MLSIKNFSARSFVYSILIVSVFVFLSGCNDTDPVVEVDEVDEFDEVDPYDFEVNDFEYFEPEDEEEFASVELNILDEELYASHGCENLSVDVEIKNTGDIPIDYLKTGSNNPHYVFMGVLDGEVFSIYPDSQFDDEEEIPVGYYYGFRNFGVLNPGEKETVRFGLSGNVRSGPMGTGGSTHIFCRGDNEDNVDTTHSFLIEFGNVREDDRMMWVGSDYDFENRSKSNEIEVYVASCVCDLSSDSVPDPL